MQFDAHVHSAVSPDSDMAPKDAISALRRKGLGVVFTEHVDYVTPECGKDNSAEDAPKEGAIDFVCDFESYPAAYRSLRANDVLLGLEIGLSAAYLPLNTKTAAGDYDYILGSVHFVDGVDIYQNASKADADTFFSRYLTYAKEMVELCGFFDCLAHIDYPARYNAQIKDRLKYENFPDEFDALFNSLAKRGLALEINTQQLGDDLTVENMLKIYRRFAQLGGRYVTIGSDSHIINNLGRNHAAALTIADAAGLKTVYYKERKKIACK